MTNRDPSLEAAFVKLMALIYRNVVQPHYKTSKKEVYATAVHNVDIMPGRGRSMTSTATIIRSISACSVGLLSTITVRLVFLCVVTDAIRFVFFNNDINLPSKLLFQTSPASVLRLILVFCYTVCAVLFCAQIAN
jgi:hypothetical protein